MTTSAAMPRRNSPILRLFGRTGLRLWNWRIAGDLPQLPKFIIIVAPHTSNWDFPLGVLAMFSLDLRIHWFGKDSLFRSPLAWLFRLLDGRAVRRETNEGVVAEMAAAIRAEPQFLLALAPEGTRKHVRHWRSGFYHIALEAGVPIVPVWFDWSTREIGIEKPFFPTRDPEGDMAALKAIYRPEMARNRTGF
jgi:1-acyl-sn-glycerol-3-phosphate acyltransferase